MSEDSFRSMPTAGFQKVKSAHRVDVEIIQRPACCKVMRRLRRTVDDRINISLPEQIEDWLSVSDVRVEVFEIGMYGLKSFHVPASVSIRAEKVRPHVVVYPYY
jgi:hypothetical protein